MTGDPRATAAVLAQLRRAARARTGLNLYGPDVARLEVRTVWKLPVIARTVLEPDADWPNGVLARVDLFVVARRFMARHTALTPVRVDHGRFRLVDPPTPAHDLLRWAWWSWRLGTAAADVETVHQLLAQLHQARPIPVLR